MIKVKGQLGEMAKCLEDEDVRIADLAKLFFSELATKDNAIYNNLPDGEWIHTYPVTKLTANARHSHQPSFCRRTCCGRGCLPEYHEIHLHVHREGQSIRLLNDHVAQHHNKQEKQAENIVEKLCQRFRLTEDPRQWRDIAFCLSLLPFKSERSVKKLIEGLQFYRDKLHEDAVFARFQEILTKVYRTSTFMQQRIDPIIGSREQVG